MREKTRQDLLKRGKALTRAQAMRLIYASHSRSWSGCLSGNDWAGKIVWLNGWKVSATEHRQNDAPTGYEVQGIHKTSVAKMEVKQGDKITLVHRFCCGRNLDGDACYKSEQSDYQVV